MTNDSYPVTDLSRVRRHPERGFHDRDTVHAILDEGLVCHVGVVVNGRPVVIPMAYGRVGDRLFLHGGRTSRLMGVLGGGTPVSISVTLVDGVVLARSTFHSSMNYRSVVAFGTARRVESEEERRVALDAVTEHIARGRGVEARPTTPSELAATDLVEITLEEASAKVRGGPPSEPESDVDFPVWAGVIPLSLEAGSPVPAPDLDPAVVPSEVVTGWRRGRGGSGSDGSGGGDSAMRPGSREEGA